jgi:hypothetical protein
MNNPLFAIQDPNWGEPEIIAMTVALTADGAWENFRKLNLGVDASLGREHCEKQGFKAIPVNVMAA